MSPLQVLTRGTPESIGSVTVRSEPGIVYVTYRFFYDPLDEDLKVLILQHLNKFHSLSLDL